MRARALLLWSSIVAATLRRMGRFGRRARILLKRSGRRTALRARSLWRPLRQRYARWPAFWQHFGVSFALGLAIEASLHFFGHGLPPVVEWQRWARDKTVALTRLYREEGWIDTSPLPGGFSRFALIDIDDSTWQSESWGGGEPFPQPRDRLMGLIDRAFNAGARVVYLDVLLDGRLDDEGMAQLKKFAEKRFGTGEQRHLLVARSLRYPPSEDAPPKMRPAFWDGHTNQAGGIQIHPVLPNYPLDTDLRVRQWHIGFRAIAPEAAAGERFYPSPQLALYCLREDRPSGAGHQALIAWCGRGGDANTESPFPDQAQPHDSVASTILFQLGERGNLGYSRWPALAVLENDSIRAFQDAVVVIGASYRESRDHYYTPVGRQAGALLNLNAMDTMLRYGHLQQLPWHTQLPLALTVIAVVAAVFAFSRGPAAVAIASGIVIGVFAFLAGPWLLLQGVWFDFGSPLLGIQLHRSIEELLAARRRSDPSSPGSPA